MSKEKIQLLSQDGGMALYRAEFSPRRNGGRRLGHQVFISALFTAIRASVKATPGNWSSGFRVQ